MSKRSKRHLAIRHTAIGLATAGALAMSGLGIAEATTTTTTVETYNVSTLGEKVVASSIGHTLYMYSGDSRTHSACTGTCNAVWKPLLTTGTITAKAGSGLTQSKLTTLSLAGGKKQVEYNGHPLYTNVGDKKAGQATGENKSIGSHFWYALNAKGNAIKSGLVNGY